MNSRTATVGCWGLLLVVAMACGTDTEPQTPPSTTSAPTTIVQPTTTLPTVTTSATPVDNHTAVEVMVREGRVVSDSRVAIPLGNRIVMRFDSDTRLQVHIHGYDQEFWVEVGTSSAHEFEANIPGVFEVEDHLTHRLMLELQVSP